MMAEAFIARLVALRVLALLVTAAMSLTYLVQ